ncbi:hypothetical protein ACGFIF_37490 [Kribbella sp. NPDC049174]|uniref:hypothetical protein n=1 Tax=Kribbella sp. NPDC049174 TaxID=3364112 RepID=UPI0037140279
MNTLPHLDAGRIYRLAPFEEVVTELRKTFADGLSVVLPHGGAVRPLAASQGSDDPLGPGQSSAAGLGSHVPLGPAGRRRPAWGRTFRSARPVVGGGRGVVRSAWQRPVVGGPPGGVRPARQRRRGGCDA